MVGPVMESKKHMEALARALESKTGAALVASPLSIGAYLVRLFGAKPDLAMSVVEIGVVVAASTGSEVHTTRFAYAAFGGMPLPVTTAGREKATVVRIVLGDTDRRSAVMRVPRAGPRSQTIVRPARDIHEPPAY